MTRALIPGSFDPVTIGHMDMINRAALLFDEIYVVAFENNSKCCLFDMETRRHFLNIACSSIKGAKVTVDFNNGLLADYVSAHGIDVVIKGARNASDFDYEYGLSLINRSIDRNAETLIMPAKAEYQHISSTVVRDLIKYGKPLDGFVPDELLAEISVKQKEFLLHTAER